MAGPRFREVQSIIRPRVPLGVGALVTVSLGWSLGESDPGVLIAGGLLVLVVAVTATVRLTVAVEDGRLRLRIFPVQPQVREVPLAAVERVEVVPTSRRRESVPTWRSWLPVPGRGSGRRVYDLSGTGAVELRRADGTVLVVGSRRPQDLAAAIDGAGDPWLTLLRSDVHGGSQPRRRRPR